MPGKGKVLLCLLAFLALGSLHPGSFSAAAAGYPEDHSPQGHSPAGIPTGDILQDRIVALFHRSDSLYRLSNSTPATDSMAFAGFVQVIAAIGTRPGLADQGQLLVRAYLEKGVLLDVRNDYAGAKQAYCTALGLPHSTDSLSFVAHVYAGTCYYNLNNFDSASYYLLRAESFAHARPAKEDEVRLYNTLGVLYYDNGNYRQGKNYFGRALEIVEGRKPMDTVSAVLLESNIASSFNKLGSYPEALTLYHKIVGYRPGAPFVYMNMGRTYAAMADYREALACFKKVDAALIPAVWNEMAAVYLSLGRMDSCRLFLDRLGKAAAINPLDIAINDLYRADLLAAEQHWVDALKILQQAIVLFSDHFRDPDIFSNPSGFTGTFAYYRLFDALYKKAQLFERLYRAQPREPYLSGAYAAYKAALAMLRYIEKSYDTDDAKLFLKKSSGAVYQGALSVCLQLQGLHPGKGWLEEAFQISERNKASIITAGLKERRFGNVPGISEGLLQQERNIKYNIARLDSRADEARDSKAMEAIAREKSGYEIELARLQKGFEQNDAYYSFKYDDSSPGIPELQQHLEEGQALISCSMSTDALHIFMLTHSSFIYTRVDSLPLLQKDIGDWLDLMKSAESGKRFRGEAIGNRLYRRLIRPIQELIPGAKEWIIVPDGMLYFLPFESLPAGEGAVGADGSGTLLETTTISYRFSCRFIIGPPAGAALGGGLSGSPGGGEGRAQNRPERSGDEVLGFAPFAGQGGGNLFPRLPASGEEIAGLPGRQYMDSMATKERFLAEMGQYPIIHLATHAVSAIDNAAESYVAFYPAKHIRSEDCLFLEELYGLNMNATKLVIISACETGQGELVSNEGVISLARAFAYAGCGSTICSLWKADDAATSAILGRFHVYLGKGDTKSRALQLAKLDYLKSGVLNKSPAYWSHLVLIGNDDPVCKPGHGYLWVLLWVAVGGLGFWVVVKRRRRVRADHAG